MTERSYKDIIKGMREIVKPFISDYLKRVNYEGKGEIDKAQFETEFEKVLTLAEKAETLSENKGDLISRQAVLDEMDKRHSEGDCITKGFIKGLPSIENKGEWIPVNGIEDIPKSGSYWITKEYGYDTLVEKIRWSDAWRCWEDNDADEVLTKESASLITAYMPYFEPEPYKAESEGTE